LRTGSHAIHYLPGNCFSYPPRQTLDVSGPPEEATMQSRQAQAAPSIPRWLRFVLRSDRAGSAWFIGMGFFFAPVLIVVSPWPELTKALWVVIALAGLWLGLLGIAMATGLAMVLRTGAELSEDYWRSIIDYPSTAKTTVPAMSARAKSRRRQSNVAAGAAPQSNVAAGAAPQSNVAAGAAPQSNVAAGAAPQLLRR
jgi:hypothetical protein